MNITIASLHTYPLKGGRALDRAAWAVEPSGLAGDRRWMLVDGDGVFVSQREAPGLAAVVVEERDGGLAIRIPDEKPVFVSAPGGDARMTVEIWSDAVSAAVADADGANAALSRTLGFPVRLVHMDRESRRAADPVFAGEGKPVSFADGFPVLLTSLASLDALNAAIGAEGARGVPMGAFRPNIVIGGGAAWDEDGWAAVKIGGIVFDAVKPCARCVVTTRDQESGIGRDDAEPVRTLARIRRSGDRMVPGVLFGVNLVPRGRGKIAAGDAVEVVETRPTPWPIAS